MLRNSIGGGKLAGRQQWSLKKKIAWKEGATNSPAIGNFAGSQNAATIKK